MGGSAQGRTEWFDTACLASLHELLLAVANLFPHTRLPGAPLFSRPVFPDIGENTNPARAKTRPLFANEAWNVARPQLANIVEAVQAIIDEASMCRIVDYRVGHAVLIGKYAMSGNSHIDRLIDRAYSQGIVRLPNGGVALVVSVCRGEVRGGSFEVGLHFPGVWPDAPLFERILSHFAQALQCLCSIEQPSPAEGMATTFYGQ